MQFLPDAPFFWGFLFGYEKAAEIASGGF